MSEENTEKTKPEESKTLTKTPKKAPVKKSTKKVDPQDDFLSNFNWHQYKEGIDELDEKQIKEFETQRFIERMQRPKKIGNERKSVLPCIDDHSLSE